jgi:hypothetical protein
MFLCNPLTTGKTGISQRIITKAPLAPITWHHPINASLLKKHLLNQEVKLVFRAFLVVSLK